MNPLMPHIQQRVAAEIVKASREPKRSKERVAITDQKALLDVDPMRILIGEIEVYDERDRQPR
jgi:hypothetical protein